MDEETIKESLDNIINQIETRKKAIENDAKLSDMFSSLFGEDPGKSNNNEIDITVSGMEVFKRLTEMKEYKHVDKLTLRIDDFTELSDEDIELIKSSHADFILDVDNIRGATSEILGKLENIHYDIDFDIYTSENPYTTEEMQEMLEAIDSFKGQIKSKSTDFEKFMEIYKILILSNDYDFAGVSANEESTQERITAARSMIGSVLQGSVVCHGFALELKQMLAYYGIESKFISGSNHAWNQVKIDGNWYNTDLTADYSAIRRKDKNALKYCLLGDEEFYQDLTPEKKMSEIPEKCPADFPRDQINAHLQDLEERKSMQTGDLGKGILRFVNRKN